MGCGRSDTLISRYFKQIVITFLVTIIIITDPPENLYELDNDQSNKRDVGFKGFFQEKMLALERNKKNKKSSLSSSQTEKSINDNKKHKKALK